MSARVLFVDDDSMLLSALRRTYRGVYDLETAISGPQGLALARQPRPFAVVVADMQMPGMDGITFLQEFARINPETTRIMLTGQADLATAIAAVNGGHVFRFLTKPSDDEALKVVIDAGVNQYRLITAERSLLEDTLSGSVQILVDLLSEFDPQAFGQAQQVRDLALRLAEPFNLPATWDLGLAGLLGQVGRLAIPRTLQDKAARGDRLDLQEQEVFRRVPEFGCRMLAHIPRLQSVSRFILYSAKDFDGEGYPLDGLRRGGLPLESRILRVATDFVANMQSRRSRPVVVTLMQMEVGKYDPEVLAHLEAATATIADAPALAGRLLDLDDLKPGMVLGADLLSKDGRMLLAAGTRLSGFHLERIRTMKDLALIEGPVLGVDGDLRVDVVG